MTEEERQALRFPLSCPICDIVMKGGTAGDDKYYYKWGCCRFCSIEFVEDREERWLSGWRPSTAEVERMFRKLSG